MPTDEFTLREHARAARRAVRTAPARGCSLRGRAATQLEKRVEIELYERHPGFAATRVSYRNTSSAHRARLGLDPGLSAPAAPRTRAPRSRVLELLRQHPRGPARLGAAGRSAILAGQLHGHDRVRLRRRHPIADVWRRDGGLAVGHLALVPLEVSLPVTVARARGVDVAVKPLTDRVLPTGRDAHHRWKPSSPCTRGDHFATLTHYRELMADRGLQLPARSALRLRVDLVRVGIRARLHGGADPRHAAKGAGARAAAGR